MKNHTVIQKIAIAGLILEAAGWLALILVYMIWVSAKTTTDMLLMALMGGNAIAFFVLMRGMIRGKKLWWILSVIWVGINLALTFTDQFGTADWIALAVNGGLLALLIVGGYKPRGVKAPG